MTRILLGWSILRVLCISLYFVLNFNSWLHRNPLRVGGIRLQNGLMRWASLMRLKHTCRNECQAQSVGLPKFTLIYTALGNLQQLLVQSHKWLWEQILRQVLVNQGTGNGETKDDEVKQFFSSLKVTKPLRTTVVTSALLFLLLEDEGKFSRAKFIQLKLRLALLLQAIVQNTVQKWFSK